MEKAIIVHLPVTDTYKARKRPEVLVEALQELNALLAEGWAVKQSSPMGTGNEAAACSLVVLEKGGES